MLQSDYTAHDRWLACGQNWNFGEKDYQGPKRSADALSLARRVVRAPADFEFGGYKRIPAIAANATARTYPESPLLELCNSSGHSSFDPPYFGRRGPLLYKTRRVVRQFRDGTRTLPTAHRAAGLFLLLLG